MSKNSVKKGKKQEEECLTAHDAVCNEFILGDIAFTLLPIGIIAILKSAFGQLDLSFFLLSDWAYASIIISSLALIRSLELKIIHQKNAGWTGIALSRTCLLLVISSVICLSLHVLKDQMAKANINAVTINDNIVMLFQYTVLSISIIFLYKAHLFREKLVFERRKFPENISGKDFHRYSLYNLRDARDNIRATRTGFGKKYEFGERNNELDGIKEYGKDELGHIIEDMEHDLKVLKERMEAWNKPPYADPAISEVPDDAAK